MDKRSAGLKDYFVVRRRIKTSEEDGKKKKTTGESPKRILSPAKGNRIHFIIVSRPDSIKI